MDRLVPMQKSVTWDASVRDNSGGVLIKLQKLLQKGKSFKRMGDVSKAIEQYSMVIDQIQNLDPSSEKIQKILATAYMLRGNAHQANREFDAMSTDYKEGKKIDENSVIHIRQE